MYFFPYYDIILSASNQRVLKSLLNVILAI